MAPPTDNQLFPRSNHSFRSWKTGSLPLSSTNIPHASVEHPEPLLSLCCLSRLFLALKAGQLLSADHYVSRRLTQRQFYKMMPVKDDNAIEVDNAPDSAQSNELYMPLDGDTLAGHYHWSKSILADLRLSLHRET
jgi:hypothetical protein